MFDVGTTKQTFADRFRKKMSERPGKPVDGGRLLRAIGRRKKWIVASIAVGLILGLMIPYWLISHEWTSKAVMEWEQPEEATGGAAGAVRDLRTLVDSVKLPTNLDEVREDLGLQMTLDELGSRLEVSFDRDSNVIAVNAKADNPEKSARIANAVVDVFLAHQSELARTRSSEAVSELEQQVAGARQSYEAAQRQYDDFRREHGISDLSLERQHAIEMAAQLQADAQLARAEARTERTRASGLQGTRTVRRSPGSSAALRRAQQELDEARATLSDRHPRVRALRQRVEELEAEAGESVVAAGGTTVRSRRDRARAEQREETYESLLEDSRTRLAQLSEVEGEASRLLSTVQVKEAALAEAEGALTRARAQATTANNGFRLLAPALPPEEPSSSNRRAMAVFILLGCVLVTILALLLWELRGLRAHTANEVAFWGRAPVLGATVWPRSQRSISAMIEELGDYALEAGGTTLVVAADAGQASVAAQVAERLHLDTDVIDHGDSVYRDPEEDLSVTVDHAPRAAENVIHPQPQPAEPGVIEVGPSSPPAGNGGGNGAALVHVGSNGNGNGRAHPLAVRMGGDWAPPRIAAWNGEIAGPPVRRAARVADRVIVVVPSGGMSFGELERLRQSLGREQDEGVGYLLVGMRDELATLPDRAGPVDSFWQARRA